MKRRRTWRWTPRAVWIGVVLFCIAVWGALFWAFETFLSPFWWR